jgi:hypothetical protein
MFVCEKTSQARKSGGFLKGKEALLRMLENACDARNLAFFRLWLSLSCGLRMLKETIEDEVAFEG